MSAEYELTWQTPGAVTLGTLHSLISCSYARADKSPGDMSLFLPLETYDDSWFVPFSRLLVHRSVDGNESVLDLETSWFLIDGPHHTLSEDGSEVIELDLVDALGLILPTTLIPYDDYSAYTYKLAAADDMCKAIVRENRGTLALDTTRSISGYMNVASDETAAPVIRLGGFAHEYALDVLQDIADASANDDTPTWMGFDIVLADAVTGLLEFRTYIGQRGADHRFPDGTKPVLLSPETGNLADVRIGVSYRDSASVIYAGGAGIADLRPVTTEQDTALLALSPFGRRERFVDASTIADAGTLQARAKAELRKARPRRYLEGRIIETEKALRGVHWNYGDYLTATYRGATYDVRADKISVKLTPAPGGGFIEKTEAHLRGEEAVGT